MTYAEIFGMLGAASAVVGMIITILVTTGRLGQMAGSMEAGMAGQNQIIREMKDEVAKLREVVTDMAVVNTRLANHEQMIAQAHKHIDELRHGEGFVFPLNMHGPNKNR